MAKFNKKLSPLINRQLPQHIQANNPLLVDFIKQYYVFMDSAQITLSSVTASDQILLETATEGFLALNGTDDSSSNAGDYILNEETSVGEFTKGETITGGTSKETSVILAEDTDNLKLYIDANSKFITGETITGSTSGAQGVISKYRANPNETLTQLLEYADVNDTLDDFFVEFRNTFLQTIPNTLTDGLDKRQLTKNILSLYKRKGTKKANEIFFRALFNETPEIYFPTVDMLRVSDGKFNTTEILKATLVSPATGDMTKLKGQTITQADIIGNPNVGKATAIVEDVTVATILVNGIQQNVATLVINKGSVTGSFVTNDGSKVLLDGTDGSSTDAGDNILNEDGSGDEILTQTSVEFTGVPNDDPDSLLTCRVESIVDDVTVSEPGRYYEVGEIVSIDQQVGGANFSGQIDATVYGSIDSVRVESGGSGYAVGDTLSVTNPTDGSDFAGEVAVVNGGFLIEQDDIENGLLLLEQGTGDQLVMEAQTNSGTNDVTKIKVTNSGGGYLTLPTATISSSTGSSATVFPISDSIGKALSVKPIDHGFRYEETPTISPKLHMQVDTLTGTYLTGETVTATKEDNIIFEPFTPLDFKVLLEDHRQAVIRLDGEEGDLITEAGESIAFEEFVTEPVFDGAELDGIITEDAEGNNRLVHTIYEQSDESNMILITHNGSDTSRLQNEDTTASTAVVEDFNALTNVLTVTNVSGTFEPQTTLTGGTSGVTGEIVNADRAVMSSTIGTAIETDGAFSGVDGFVSENTKKIQDSLYYQDYSYIIRVGESISNWRDSLKSAIHPAGFYFGGEVNIVNRVNNRMKTGFTRLSGLTETDEVIEILSVIFDEKIGRRLGTPTDGSSLRTNPELAIEADASFTASTRATTVNQEFKLKLGQDNNHTLRSLTATRGIGIYSGPTLNTINNLASTAFDHTPDRILLNTSADENDGLLLEDGGDIKQEFGLRDMDSGITIAILNNIKLFGTGNSTLDNNAARFEEFNNASKIKTSFAIPCQIRTTIS
tara:strand:- start:1841 stop:4864 length:3024 start_codon:yes stop_codon:yes gene_type:complete